MNMDIGQNNPLDDVEFQSNDPEASIRKLHEKTNDELNAKISHYLHNSEKWKPWSYGIRFVSVLTGGLAALSLNSIVITPLSIQESDIIPLAGVFVILAGTLLSFDYAFSITRKYSNRLAFAFELEFDKYLFDSAIYKLYKNIEASLIDEETFREARILANEAISTSRQKCLEEKKGWALNLQSVMAALRRSNKDLSPALKSAAKESIRKQEAAKAQRQEKKKKYGLTVNVDKKDGRSETGLICHILDKEGKSAVVPFSVTPGQSISDFYSNGLYTVTLKSNGEQIASHALTLDKDKQISL